MSEGELKHVRKKESFYSLGYSIGLLKLKGELKKVAYMEKMSLVFPAEEEMMSSLKKHKKMLAKEKWKDT